MQTLTEYNESTVRNHVMPTIQKAGVICPICAVKAIYVEMFYPTPNLVLMSYPGKMEVMCPNCGHSDYKYV